MSKTNIPWKWPEARK